jgi:AbrB family looped-hinge helix DNA binding protein
MPLPLWNTFRMKTTKKADTVLFAAKGQIVIPAWLRREFQIESGSRAIVQATPDGILLKPVTKYTIGKLHGILRRKPGEKSMTEAWVEHKHEESRLEEPRPEKPGHGHRS